MILYFNCKLTGNVLTPPKLNEYFYPLPYPRPQNILEPESQITILIKAIKSYALINFDVVIFNLDIDNLDEAQKNRITEVVGETFDNSKIHLKFSRASTIEQWIDDINSYKDKIDFNKPVMVSMNHDHLFVDHSFKSLEKAVANVFSSATNFGKVLYYSHAPEVNSWAINGRENHCSFVSIENGLYKSSLIDDWMDSIGIMSMETLLHIWKRADYKGNYIGRIDWKGVKYSKLKLTAYVFPREFVKHYDGYTHITGTRLISQINSESFKTSLPLGENNITELIDYYYQKWLDNYILLIRDYLIKNQSIYVGKRGLFINAIEISIKLFNDAYLVEDLCNECISEKEFHLIKDNIYNRIYYDGNYLFSTVDEDIKLLEKSLIENLKIMVIENQFLRFLIYPFICIRNQMKK